MTIKYRTKETKPAIWIDGKPANERDFNQEDFVKETDEDMFHIGQSYENGAAKTLECVKCGSKEFNVGSGNYFTAIRCVKCEWEYCIHDG